MTRDSGSGPEGRDVKQARGDSPAKRRNEDCASPKVNPEDSMPKDEIKLKAEFTPGPWHVHDPGPYDLMQVRGEPDEGTGGPKVCDINDIGGYLGDFEANAHLIAAAPELYEACALVDAYLYATGAGDSNEAQIVRLAIAKARGEQVSA
jgi:hypothetical protein